MSIKFDDSLGVLAGCVAEVLGADQLMCGVVLRDSTGRLAFFSSVELDQDVVNALSDKLSVALGPYARKDRVLVNSTDYGAASVLGNESALRVQLTHHKISLIDLRIAGADWLRAPVTQAPPPSRFVFSSIKGGVGRSTSLAVVAAELAGRGLRVLAVDLDIEAPGLGPILLNEDTLPEFGLLDALVENGISPLDEAFLADIIGPSHLSYGKGRIDVIPVLGKRSLNNPAEVLAKIARAYNENIVDDRVDTILDQIKSLIDSFSDPRRYDAILIDARAGLHETTASAILGLGAEVFLFGLDEPQTFQGFKILLAHMARFDFDGIPAEWLSRFTFIQGKAPSELGARQSFAEQCQNLFTEVGSGFRKGLAVVDVELEEEVFHNPPWNDDISDAEVLPSEDLQLSEPLFILFDPRFSGFNPQKQPDLLSNGVYTSSYGQLIDKVISSIQVETEVPL
ncbi:hypothetical protein DJ028_15005 [Pseudomonas veronii]|uniref:ParA family protein n=1 Tax=Pseudomonas veronii TaxID=76761 RepID=UPI000FE437F8|nr:AAA family ATPase [Pseudomonas veronii]RWA26770.1 hypothetical protein DJ028_15005 [Pseudomonas veronii]